MDQRRPPQILVALALSTSIIVLAGLIAIMLTNSALAPAPAVASPHAQSAPFTSTLVINEVFRSSNPANDYMEFYNGNSTQPVSLFGLVIRNSVSETSLSTLYTTTIQPQSYLAISPAMFIPPRTTLVGNGLQASDYLALAPTVGDQPPVDLVNWADPNPTWYYFINYQNYFLRPRAAMPAPDGLLSMSRYPNGYDTDTSAEWYQLRKSAGYANPLPCRMNFNDVGPSDYFFEAVRYLSCRGAISGYADNTFRPYNNTTRGQLCKIVVLGFGMPIYTPTTPTFRDVPSSNTFYWFVESAYHSNLVSGYTCGGQGEPCPGLYFRPGNPVTRGQLSKVVVLAADWSLLDPSSATFSDVPVGSTFFRYVETAYSRGIISGYNCGEPGEPCPGLYFRPGSSATRGQIAKVIYQAITAP